MTHWVIIKKNGKIYAGVDKLRSGPDYPSELSGTGTMPGVHDETDANKLVQYGKSHKECVICCAGKSYPINKTTRRSNLEKDMTRILRDDILPSVDFSLLTDAKSLLNVIVTKLTNQYIIDQDKNSVLLGLGFIDNTVSNASASLSIAYFDSRASTVQAVHNEYLNMELLKRDLLDFERDPNFIIRDEINQKSLERRGRVGRDANSSTIEYSYATPANSKPASSSKSGIFSKKGNKRTVEEISEPSNTESDQQSWSPSCVIS